MKVNLTAKLKSLDGKVMLMDAADAKSEATLKKMIPNILLGEYVGEKIEAEEKLNRYKIAVKVSECLKGEIELTAEEIVLIKRLAGIGCNPLTYGELCKNLPK